MSRDDAGWVVSSTGRMSGPLELAIRRFEMRYDEAWRPLELTIDLDMSGKPFWVHTAFHDTVAVNEIVEDGKPRTKTDTISADAIVLPTNLFGAYEALAARLSTVNPGTVVPVYIAPQAEISIRLNRVSEQYIVTPDQTVTARVHHVTVLAPGNPFDAEIWADTGHRLVRISMPSVGLEIARTDVVSAGARRLTSRNERDEDVRIPASGFSLMATVTPPEPDEATDEPEWPAVILVPGSGSRDRDEVVSGVSLYGDLAAGLSDAGFLVIRFDKRGVGQSGGRTEAATLADYAQDVRSIVRYLRDRKDVDSDRIAVAGHDEGGWIAMLAASKERRIKALALIATPASRGDTWVIEQQQLTLAQLSLNEEERQAKIALQRKIHAAVISGGGWEEIPFLLRAHAETPWFKSFLRFDPAEVLEDVRQPIVIVHGELDRQIEPTHGERLAELARARKRRVPVELVRLAGLNHLLVPAVTGRVDEYEQLENRQVSDDLIAALSQQLHTLLPAR